MKFDVHELEQRVGVHFSAPGFITQALTHPSFEHERSGAGGGNYQRLEFLGDAILGMVLADILYTRFPDANEGHLSRFRSQMADQENLARIARGIGLGGFIRLGRGEEQDGGRDKDSILSDVLEAVIGAVYLDRGIDAARGLIWRLFCTMLETSGAIPACNDPKSELQELLSARRMGAPQYRLMDEFGPPHDRLFFFQVLVEGDVAGEGRGRSKKTAQQAAAAQALKHLLEMKERRE